MKYLAQFGIILLISFIGEVLNRIIPLPIPASIYGMVLLFAGLVSGLIKLSSVKDTGKFLIDIMPMLFIPATVGLIESWVTMKNFLVALVVISLVSTLTVAAASGRITQYIINRKTKEKR
jgi:holin-like protein